MAKANTKNQSMSNAVAWGTVIMAGLVVVSVSRSAADAQQGLVSAPTPPLIVMAALAAYSLNTEKRLRITVLVAIVMALTALVIWAGLHGLF